MTTRYLWATCASCALLASSGMVGCSSSSGVADGSGGSTAKGGGSSEWLTCKNGEFYLNGKPFTDCSQCSNSTEPCFDVTYEYINDGFVQIVGRETATCHGQTVSMYHGVCQSVGPGGNPAAGGAGISTYPSTGGNSAGPAGGVTSAGGSTTASTLSGCALDAGPVLGNPCAPNPLIFPLDANCTLGFWAGDGISTGYFSQPWCNNATTACTLTMVCATNSMHVAGSYTGSTGNTMDGNAGWGAQLQVNSSDAGPGCQMIDAGALTGLTLDINVTTIPAGNHLYLGINLANGNTAEYTIFLATGAQTVRIPWGSFRNDKACGSIPGPGITDFYIAFNWFSDSASHAVDITISNLGFY